MTTFTRFRFNAQRFKCLVSAFKATLSLSLVYPKIIKHVTPGVLPFRARYLDTESQYPLSLSTTPVVYW